jgi:RNA polymerase sigma factor (sigma-70 family)
MSAFDSLPTASLTRAQEDALALRIQADGRPNDVNKLVMSVIRESVIYGRRVSRDKISDEELISICYDALVKNARRFQPGRVRFFAFAKAGVRGAISRSWKVKDVVRNGTTEPHGEDDSSTPTPEQEIVEPDFQTIFTNDRWEHVAKVIERQCNAQEKTVLTLAYKSGFNFQEIGDMLNVTRSAIHSTHQRALKKVRCELLRQKRLFV